MAWYLLMNRCGKSSTFFIESRLRLDLRYIRLYASASARAQCTRSCRLENCSSCDDLTCEKMCCMLVSHNGSVCRLAPVTILADHAKRQRRCLMRCATRFGLQFLRTPSTLSSYFLSATDRVHLRAAFYCLLTIIMSS